MPEAMETAKPQYYLIMKRFIFPLIMLAILVADVAQVLYALFTNKQPEAYAAGLLLFSGVSLIGWVLHDINSYTPAVKPADDSLRTDNQRPDRYATREWVEVKMNGATSNCIRRHGGRDSELEERISELEDARSQRGYVFRINAWSASNGHMPYYALSLHPDKCWEDKYFTEVAIVNVKMSSHGRIIGGDFTHAGQIFDMQQQNYEVVCAHAFGDGQHLESRAPLSVEMVEKLDAYLASLN